MGLSLDGDALCNRCALFQDTLEIRFDPQDGKIYEDLIVCVRVDQTIDRPERQVVTVRRMGDVKRVARFKLDCPKTH